MTDKDLLNWLHHKFEKSERKYGDCMRTRKLEQGFRACASLIARNKQLVIELETYDATNRRTLPAMQQEDNT
jgi:hypothetical protein